VTLHVISRQAWGAVHDAGFGARALPTAEAWLHHTVTLAPDLEFQDLNADSLDDDEVQAMRTIERIGEQRFGKGFSYNLAVMPSGRVYEGCGVGRVGSHTGGRNTRALGVCLVGNYQDTAPTQPMQDALVAILQEGHRLGWIDQPKFDGGHRDLSSTACPGEQAYRLIPDLNARAAGSPVTPPPPPAPAPKPGVKAPAFPLRAGAYFGPEGGPRESVSGYHGNREDLRRWQRRMAERGWKIATDGLYGPKGARTPQGETARVAGLFQREKGLRVDSLIGPATWRAAWESPVT
jgi:hypothetical protein